MGVITLKSLIGLTKITTENLYCTNPKQSKQVDRPTPGGNVSTPFWTGLPNLGHVPTRRVSSKYSAPLVDARAFPPQFLLK